MRIRGILVFVFLVCFGFSAQAQEKYDQAEEPEKAYSDAHLNSDEVDASNEDHGIDDEEMWVVPEGFDDDEMTSDADEVKPVVETGLDQVIQVDVEETSNIALPDPYYTIEEIRITGNSMTSDARVRAILQISEGQEIQLSTLENAKARLSALGSFEMADVRLLPGSDKGHICVEVRLAERMHIQINDYYVGLSDKSRFWLGMSTSFLNPLGSGHRFNLSFVATPKSEYAFNFNYVIPNIGGSNFYVSLGIHSAKVREEVFIRAPYINQVSSEVLTHDYLGINRHGATLFAGIRPLSVLSLALGVQFNALHRFDDHVQEEKRHVMDDYILPEKSMSTTGFVSLFFDTRKSPRMPEQGHFVGLNLGGTFKSTISDYKYFRAFIFHQSNFTLVPDHVIRIMSSAGAIVGEAPYYDKYQYADFYPMNPARISTFKPSSAGALDLFRTGTADLGYEDFLVNLGIEYAWHMGLLKANIRRLEVYIRLNAVYADSLDVPTLALGNDPGSRSRGVFPVDAGADFGVRFETEFGFFKVSLGYILNMVPR